MQLPKKGILKATSWTTCHPSLFLGRLFRADSLEEGKASCPPCGDEPNLTVAKRMLLMSLSCPSPQIAFE